MNDYLREVGSFHAKFGLDGKELPQPGFMDEEMAQYRLGFQLEELCEYAEAIGFKLVVKKDGELKFEPDPEAKKDLVKALDGLVDQQYVLSGTIRFQGFAQYRFDPIISQRIRVFDGAFWRVHTANMRKVRAAVDGANSKRGSSLDVIKPVGWKPPVLDDLLA